MPSRYIPPALRGTTASDESTPSESAANRTTTENDINGQIRRLSDLELKSPSQSSYENRYRGRGNIRSRGRGRGRGRGSPSFYQDGNGKRNFQDYDDGRKTGMRTIDEIHEHYWPTKMWEKRSTLNDSEDRRGELAYIILFRGANPRWSSERIIFAKTNINYLPRVSSTETAVGENPTAPAADKKEDKGSTQDDTLSREVPMPRIVSDAEGPSSSDVVTQALHCDTGTPAVQTPGRHTSQDIRLEEKEQEPPPVLSTKPIAVFEQLRYNQTGRSYRFKDWFLLSRLDFLQPHSPGLVRMLQQKWSGTDDLGQTKDPERREAAWQTSLSVEWAVIKLVQENEEREQPDIAVHESKDFTNDETPFDRAENRAPGSEAGGESKQSEEFKNEGATADPPFNDWNTHHISEGTKDSLDNKG